MNENAKKWVAALRSGEFEQGRGYLLATGKHCCLGVACAIYQREVGGLDETEGRNGIVIFDGCDTLLPILVQRWLGMSTFNGSFAGDKDCLSEMNDRGTPFSEIADLIESEPEGLFCE